MEETKVLHDDQGMIVPVPVHGMIVPMPADGMIVPTPVCADDADHADEADRDGMLEDECPVDVRNDQLLEMVEDDDEWMMMRKPVGRVTELLHDDSTSRKDAKLEDVMTEQPIGMPDDDGRK